MKFRTTEKAMKEGCYCQSVPYCDLQNLLSVTDPIAYTCGVYGWYADIYTNGNLAIVTGYKPFGKKYISDEEIRYFEKESNDIDLHTNLNWKQRRKRKEALLNKFWQLFRKRVMEGN